MDKRKETVIGILKLLDGLGVETDEGKRLVIYDNFAKRPSLCLLWNKIVAFS